MNQQSTQAQKTDKEGLVEAIEAFGKAHSTGNAILINVAGMLVKNWLARLPDKFPPLEPTTRAEPVLESTLPES